MKLRVRCLITIVICLGFTFAIDSQVVLNHPLPKDAGAALSLAREVNSLDSAGVKPWHIRGRYTFYSDGVKVDEQGVYEEWWVSPTQYKRSFMSDKFKQTEYATGTGLFRDGSQEWLGGLEMNMLTSLLAPLPEKELDKEFNFEKRVKKVADGKLDCLTLQIKDFSIAESSYKNPSNPEACFELNMPILRVNFMTPFLRAAYDEIAEFQGRYLAKEVTIYVNHQMLSHLNLDVVEELKEDPQSLLAPPSSAKAVDLNLVPSFQGDNRIWPAALALIHEYGIYTVGGQQTGVIKVRFNVNSDGRVSEQKVIEGPMNALRTFNALYAHNIFRPLIVLGKPVKYEMEMALNLRAR